MAYWMSLISHPQKSSLTTYVNSWWIRSCALQIARSEIGARHHAQIVLQWGTWQTSHHFQQLTFRQFSNSTYQSSVSICITMQKWNATSILYLQKMWWLTRLIRRTIVILVCLRVLDSLPRRHHLILTKSLKKQNTCHFSNSGTWSRLASS